MIPNNLEKERIERAREQVKKIKNFYTHLLVYVLINLIIVVKNIEDLGPDESYFQVRNFITFSLWGIVIIIHALNVFLPNFILGKKWEERKIKKYMKTYEKQTWE